MSSLQSKRLSNVFIKRKKRRDLINISSLRQFNNDTERSIRIRKFRTSDNDKDTKITLNKINRKVRSKL